MNNTELIHTTVKEGQSAAILKLLHQFLDRSDRSSCRELLTEIMLQQDIEDVSSSKDARFGSDVLSGDGWTGYSHLSFAQIIQEFDNRELSTNYFDLDLDSSALLRDRLLALADESTPPIKQFTLTISVDEDTLKQAYRDSNEKQDLPSISALIELEFGWLEASGIFLIDAIH